MTFLDWLVSLLLNETNGIGLPQKIEIRLKYLKMLKFTHVFTNRKNKHNKKVKIKVKIKK